MVINSARKTVRNLFSKKARAVVLKSLGLTLLLFFGVWFGLQQMASVFLIPFVDHWGWVITSVTWVLGIGIVVGAGFLLAPVTALFAGLFLDEVAEHVEATDYPEDKPGRPIALSQSLFLAIRLGIVVLLANLVALMLVWFAGFGVIVFFLLNGFLLGREYFVFAAMRLRSPEDARAFMKHYSLEAFLAGLIIAAVMSIPVFNLLTPVFAAILMVHLHKELSRRQPE